MKTDVQQIHKRLLKRKRKRKKNSYIACFVKLLLKMALFQCINLGINLLGINPLQQNI